MAQQTVLVGEDDEAYRLLLENAFSDAGFTVLQASNGTQALALARSEKPDAVVLDIIMPEMEGTDVLKELRADEGWGAEVPIIMLTQLEDMDHVSSSVEGGATSYLVKSTTKLEELVETVTKRIAEQREQE